MQLFTTGEFLLLVVLQLANLYHFFKRKSLFRGLTWVVAVGFTVVAYSYHEHRSKAFYLQLLIVVSWVKTFHRSRINTLSTAQAAKKKPSERYACF